MKTVKYRKKRFVNTPLLALTRVPQLSKGVVSLNAHKARLIDYSFGDLDSDLVK